MQATIQNFFSDFLLTIRKLSISIPFIRKHRVWDGFWRYNWVTYPLLALGLLAGYKFWQQFFNWIAFVKSEGISGVLSNIEHTLPNIVGQAQHLALGSSFKYIILILMEIMIFHAIAKTLAILSKEPLKPVKLKVFLEAQWRMIMIGFYVWIIEMVGTILIKVAIGLFGLSFLLPILVFLLQAFLLGFTMIDNYNEFYHKMDIKKSIEYAQQIIGVAIPIGIIVYLLLLIPLIGAVAAPLVGAVAAALTLFELEKKRKPTFEKEQITDKKGGVEEHEPEREDDHVIDSI